MRFSLFLTFALIAALAQTPAIHAQTNPCTCTETHNRPVTVCINGVNYAMHVGFCEQNYNPPASHPCAVLNQDRVSIIKRVCFDSTYPVGLTNAQILGYILCDIASKGCNPGNQWGVNVPNLGKFCWLIRMPKCTMFASNCVLPCEDCYLCTYLYEWDKTTGICTFVDKTATDNRCPSTETCDEPCEEGCPVKTCCP